MTSVDFRAIDSALRILQFALPFTLLFIAFVWGRFIEARHQASIREREQRTRGFPCVTFEELPGEWERASLLTGNVVISLDLFRRVLAGLRALVGGEVRSYVSLLDRARREALLRLKEAAIAGGYDAVTNIRFETARLASARSDGRGTAGIELFAYGTGVVRRDE